MDSGATHPLRARKKGEKISHLPKVDVTLAGDQQVSMRLSPTGVIIGEEHAEPIVPMGLLASSLKCSITWTGNGVEIIHPKLGPLDVKLQDGCPTVPHDVALTLIKEIEDLASVAIKSIQLNNHTELQWMKRLVDEHPVFAPLPEDIKNALVEIHPS